MAKYEKRVITVDAWKWEGKTLQEAKRFLSDAGLPTDTDTIKLNGDGSLIIGTPEMCVHPGDFVLRGVGGEVYPCSPDIFHAAYRPLEQDDDG